VAVSSDDNYFTVEAPPPPRERPNFIKWLAVAAIPVCAGGAAQFYTPRILDVEAPQRAVAGTTLQVPYQVSGFGSVVYDFRTHDGLQLSAGLTSQSGVLNLRIPPNGTGSPYTLHLHMRNFVLQTQDSITIAAVVPVTVKAKPAAGPGALIKNLAVTPSPVSAGKSIVVNYAADAQSGDVFVVDAAGTTWARGAFSVSGSTRLDIPKAAAGRDMRVILHAQRGAQHAESSVAISVLPSPVVTTQNTAATSPQSRPAAPAPPAPPALTLSSQVVSPGDTVTANISGVPGDVRITLMSASGATLAQGDADENSGVTLNAPNVSTPTTFYVVATLTSGVSQQTIVKRLVVTPR
jgi:hypothetical protein